MIRPGLFLGHNYIISKYEGEKVSLTEAEFRFLMNEDAMATEKLAEGIRNFSIDLRKLEDHIKAIMNLS